MNTVNRKSLAACSALQVKLQGHPNLICVGIGAEGLIVYATDAKLIEDKVPSSFNGFDVTIRATFHPVPA